VLDNECHQQWLEWAKGHPHVQTCAYWVDNTHKTLPHGLKHEVDLAYKGIQHAGRSVHINAQAFVKQTRTDIEHLRAVPTKSKTLVISRGFHSGTLRYLWGWTRLVKIRYPKVVGSRGRPSFYLRKNRFQFAYAYPQPGTDWWYAGSNLVSQKSPKSLEIGPKYQSWKERFHELADGAAEVVAEGEMLEGWRPHGEDVTSGHEGYKADAHELVESIKGGYRFAPMATNGFRHFPELWRQLSTVLGLD
jgi:hypothetical protein